MTTRKRSTKRDASPLRVSRALWITAVAVAGGLVVIFSAMTGGRDAVNMVDGHWRTEASAKQRDIDVDKAIKEAQEAAARAVKEHNDKDERELKSLAYDAKSGRAWMSSNIADVKEVIAGIALDLCLQRAQNGKGATCREKQTALDRATAEATSERQNAKSVASGVASVAPAKSGGTP